MLNRFKRPVSLCIPLDLWHLHHRLIKLSCSYFIINWFILYPTILLLLTVAPFQLFALNLITCTKNRVIRKWTLRLNLAICHSPPSGTEIFGGINLKHLLASASNLPEDLALNCLLPYLESWKRHSVMRRRGPDLVKETPGLIIMADMIRVLHLCFCVPWENNFQGWRTSCGLMVVRRWVQEHCRQIVLKVVMENVNWCWRR